ncbi:MAG: hypothetical protein AAGJ94_01535 [Pseudomonadota bacterium]
MHTFMWVNVIRNNNLKLQFFAYESGNAIAAIAGGGGFGAFAGHANTLMKNAAAELGSGLHPFAALLGAFHEMVVFYPDLCTVLGITLIALAGPMLRARVVSAVPTRRADAVSILFDAVLTLFAATLLAYTIAFDAGMVTRSAAAFVVGSAFLKQAANRAVFLKLGALFLAVGGVFLAGHGVEGLVDAGPQPHWLALLTTGTGVYVTVSSLLTYEGGIMAGRAEADRDASERPGDRLWHARTGGVSQVLTNVLDTPILLANSLARGTLLLAIPQKMREQKPFATSMWARLPWRAVTCCVAAISGAWAFALANAAWAAGDVAIGSMDWEA